jgi:hypothetical protein
LVNACWKEKNSTEYGVVKGKDLFSTEREKYFNSKGWSLEAIRDLRTRKMDLVQLIKVRDQNILKQDLNSKISDVRYNVRYKKIGIGIEKPKYLIKANMDKVELGDKIRAHY